MLRILHLPHQGIVDALKTFPADFISLANNEIRRIKLEKLHTVEVNKPDAKIEHFTIYSIRLTDEWRVILTKITKKNNKDLEPAWLLLDSLPNHEYDRCKFLNAQYCKSFFSSFNISGCVEVLQSTDDAEIVIESESTVVNELKFSQATFYNRKFIEFNGSQEAILKLFVEGKKGQDIFPATIIGGPGSGKTLLAENIIMQHIQMYIALGHDPKELKIAYITKNPYLCAKMRESWLNSPLYREEYKDIVQFLTDKEILMQYHPGLAKTIAAKKTELTHNGVLNENVLNPWLTEYLAQSIVPERHLKAWLIDYIEKNQFKNTAKNQQKMGIAGLSIEFLDQIEAIYQDCRILSGYSESQYKNSTFKAVHFTDPLQKKWIYEALQNYQNDLADKQLVNPAFAKLEITEPLSLAILDEAQDHSEGTLNQYKNIAGENTVFLLDMNQSLVDHKSKLEYLLKHLYFDQKKEMHHLTLTTNERCAKRIVALANFILLLKQYIMDGSTDKRIEAEIFAAINALVGEINWRDINKYTAKEKENLKDYYKSLGANLAVITTEENKEKAREIFATERVYTIDEFKGLEVAHLVLFEIMPEDVFKEINEALKDVNIEDLNKKINKSKDKTIFEKTEHLTPIIHMLYTSITRALKEIDFYQTEHSDLRHLMRLIKTKITQIKVQIKEEDDKIQEVDPIVETTWYESALQDLVAGNIKQAKAVFDTNLDEKEKTELRNFITRDYPEHLQYFVEPKKPEDQAKPLLNIEPIIKESVPATPAKKEIKSKRKNKNRRQKNKNRDKNKDIKVDEPKDHSRTAWFNDNLKKYFPNDNPNEFLKTLDHVASNFFGSDKDRYSALLRTSPEEVIKSFLAPENGKILLVEILKDTDKTQSLYIAFEENPGSVTKLFNKTSFSYPINGIPLINYLIISYGDSLANLLFSPQYQQIANEITGEHLNKTVGPMKNNAANFSLLLFWLKTELGRKIFLKVLELNPNLALEIKWEIFFWSPNGTRIGDPSPLHYLLEDNAGWNVLKKIIEVNQEFAIKLSELLFYTIVFGEGQDEEILFDVFLNIKEMVEVLNILIKQNPQLASRITADELFKDVEDICKNKVSRFHYFTGFKDDKVKFLETLFKENPDLDVNKNELCDTKKFNDSNVSAFYSLSTNSAGQAVLLYLLQSRPHLIKEITWDDFIVKFDNKGNSAFTNLLQSRDGAKLLLLWAKQNKDAFSKLSFDKINPIYIVERMIANAVNCEFFKLILEVQPTFSEKINLKTLFERRTIDYSDRSIVSTIFMIGLEDPIGGECLEILFQQQKNKIKELSASFFNNLNLEHLSLIISEKYSPSLINIIKLLLIENPNFLRTEFIKMSCQNLIKEGNPYLLHVLLADLECCEKLETFFKVNPKISSMIPPQFLTHSNDKNLSSIFFYNLIEHTHGRNLINIWFRHNPQLLSEITGIVLTNINIKPLHKLVLSQSGINLIKIISDRTKNKELKKQLKNLMKVISTAQYIPKEEKLLDIPIAEAIQHIPQNILKQLSLIEQKYQKITTVATQGLFAMTINPNPGLQEVEKSMSDAAKPPQ